MIIIVIQVLCFVVILLAMLIPSSSIAQVKNYVYVQRNDSVWVKNMIGSDSVRLYPPDSVVIAKATVVAAQKIDTAAPYMRVSKNTSLAISTSWQTINYSPGATSQDINLYPVDSTTGKKMVWYDTTLTNRLFKFTSQNNYTLTLYTTITTTGITTRSNLQARFVIPNGNGAGQDFYFPFPNNGGFQDLTEATILNNVSINQTFQFPLYVAQILKANGMYLQLRLSNGLVALGACTLNASAFLVQQVK